MGIRRRRRREDQAEPVSLRGSVRKRAADEGRHYRNRVRAVRNAPVYTKHGFHVELVSPREPEAVKRALASRPDLVSVHSPPFLHRDHVMKAIEGGCAVLCDKPFGLTRLKRRPCATERREAGVLHFLNCEFRCNLARVKMKELIDEGAIGVVEHVSTILFSNGLRGRNHAGSMTRSLGAVGSGRGGRTPPTCCAGCLPARWWTVAGSPALRSRHCRTGPMGSAPAPPKTPSPLGSLCKTAAPLCRLRLLRLRAHAPVADCHGERGLARTGG